MKRLLIAVPFVLALVVGGCGGDDANPAETTSAKVYFLRDGKVWPVEREVEAGDGMTTALAEALAEGPTPQEQNVLDLGSEVRDAQTILGRAGLAQWVYTMTQLPGASSVEVGGKTYTRSDFEEQTPSVLVESPLAFGEVSTPLRAKGTANTFEATFQYELVDSDGKVVDKNFVTATSGTGTRGTFDFTTKAVDDVAALRVFENSAEDGSRIHEVEIPLSSS